MSRILVVGDSCTDEFVYCKAGRLAPDFPVPVLQVQNKVTNPGMAANVCRNILSKIEECHLVTNDNYSSILKTRYVHESTNHMFMRVDSEAEIASIQLDTLNLDYELIVISDYNKGFLTESDVEFICDSHPNVFLDTKKVLGNWADKAKYIKINDFEYRASKPYLTKTLQDKIIHTRGGDGCDFQSKNYPVGRVEIKDTSGAGDSFMAALVAEYLVSQSIEKSIIAANSAASIVVRSRGVGVI
jgi:D-beta-D-heptose 7-phosphate kinase/D-beta-D-heptose 1-phosphate adenosyltransferase